MYCQAGEQIAKDTMKRYSKPSDPLQINKYLLMSRVYVSVILCSVLLD